ncbi:cell division protein FtsZ [Pustulibacterium marinum]|uniref:Cell division protein FtsZ n=1 Tax=Pustulibacterium marinum TaxID=1224947 RepID=A0A1I7GLM1_9FLAO|nr:cell division protein FtsZ [Pustulibacterium marinum]SFU49334.1 cell division protein FtsZ [Pustulibacterium marinum]
MTNNTDFGNISFDLPKNQSNVIKVIGVGGGGSNAINHMFQQGIKGVDFVICNTDAQALQNSSIPNKIQLGVSLTEGLGAGANPDVGEQAAIESLEEIKTMLDTNTKMVFITAGMGGGTGTGAAPVIAKLAKDLDILTVGIVTMPFMFEGKMRNEQSQKGIENLRKHVDSLIVINNNKLREVYGNLGFKAGFSKADEVLATASRGIAEVITHHYTQNIDLRDAKTVLSNSGTAIMGSAQATGTNRAQEAIVQALDSPLLNDNKIAGAKNVLLLIVSGAEEITIDEIGEINDHIQDQAGHSANIIMGVGEDDSLGDAIAVTVIATGFNLEQQHDIVNVEAKKIIHTLEDEQRATQSLSPKATASTYQIEKVDAPIAEETPNAQDAVVQEAPVEEEVKVIKHTLEEEVEEEVVKPVPTFDGYVSTTDEVKEIDVVAHESFEQKSEYSFLEEDDFVIVDTAQINSIEENVEPEVEGEKDQFVLSFDMPFEEDEIDDAVAQMEDEKENVIMFDLSEETEEIEVKEALEVVPPTANEDGEIRYSLEDYMDFEAELENAKPQSQVQPEVKKEPAKPIQKKEESIVFEKKTVAQEVVQEQEQDDVDPFNIPISDTLRSRADERRRKLKDFNYKFNNNINKIEEIEKEPAYKRMGIDLNPQPTISNASRLSLSKDSNDELQLRSNNSFLHDNVD